MIDKNQIAAEQATFRSFANSYLRELNPGIPVFHRIGERNFDCVEISLPTRHAVLRIEIKSRSLCGMHLFGQIWIRQDAGLNWREIEPLLALHMLVLSAAEGGSATHRQIEVELIERIFLSCQATKRYLDAADRTAPSPVGFIAAEQSLYFGHPLHPTPKSLQGMTDWQQAVYAPELRGCFQLTYFAAAAHLVRGDSARNAVASIVESLLGNDAGKVAAGNGETLLPMHPLQAEALMLDPPVRALMASGQIRHLGPAGSTFTATSSVRTVYSDAAAWMPKFSLPIRITNSRRLNRRHELEAGVAVARLFERAGIDTFDPRLGFLHDSAYVTLDIPGQAESGFEVIFRENPFRGRAGDPVITVSALTAEPPPGGSSLFESVIRSVARNHDITMQHACRRWFECYLDCALDPLVRLYDRFGVALEAHQQNSLLDLSQQGLPSRYLYRDSQGFYLSNAFKARWYGLVPEIVQVRGLFFDDREIRDRFSYYLIVNQIFSVIARAGHDGLASEAELLGVLRTRLKKLAGEMTGAGGEFAAGLLDKPNITAKANLAIRLRNVDELAASGNTIYTHFPNPLSRIGLFKAAEMAHAIAS
ncbi:Siderophore synthetase component [Mesorhizobium albiziae]|uniref:Siderophore synthetase component n=1 Tax=Neomesorhizobium albiziae TaxID=335020 RepID=A0A1I4E2J4_9HYPH|nr:IucA/IucC family protein [Mesorhizobium albiziae]GLS31193.1 petrobactin biosynthesis protein AsbA [Mesorhizobium albiziae]SFK98797.1 Siderophore synthetase component [Mesorhizobium albiziae]